jgi:hypothetical protein
MCRAGKKYFSPATRVLTSQRAHSSHKKTKWKGIFLMSMFAFVQKTALYDLENVNRAHMTSSLQYTQDQDEWLLPSPHMHLMLHL